MLMALIRYWSIYSSRTKRNQSTPTYRIKLLNIISSLLLLPKTKFSTEKKTQRFKAISISHKGNEEWYILWIGIYHRSCCRVWNITAFSVSAKVHLSQTCYLATIFTSITYFSLFYTKLSIVNSSFSLW